MGLFDLFDKKVDSGSEWAQLIYGETKPGKMLSQKMVEADTKQAISFRLRAIQDCVKLVNETTTPGVFFSRYDTMIEHMEWMARIEKYYPFKHPFPSENLERVKRQKVATINDFIDRSYQKLMLSLLKLKTEKGRRNKVADWYNLMTFYSDKMEDENVMRYSEIYSRYQPETYQ